MPSSVTKPQPPHDQQHLPCPRCNANNTKFCYYNNYNLAQPRYFCKACRRYWTQGGALRNIPIGGGTRRNSKRNSTTTSMAPPPLPPPPPPPPAPAPAPAPLGFTYLLNSQGGVFDGFQGGGGGGVWSSFMNFGSANMWQLGNDWSVWPDAAIPTTTTKCLNS